MRLIVNHFHSHCEQSRVYNISGFSLHAGVFANADEPAKLEKLCRYISRPAVSEQRLKRVFNIDITECEKCQSHNVTIIACIIEPAIIHKILSHLDKHGSSATANSARMPPFEAVEQTTVFDDFTIQRNFDFGA